jgi:CheY-like chemotaxis protein
MDAALTAPHGPIWYGASVLVVDDVRTAADGQAAITMLEGLGTLPAIVITDLQMRGGSGEGMARVLTRRYPDVPVIFMTAFLALYRTAYLPRPILEKPFRADQLCELIGSVLTAAPGLRSRALGPAPARSFAP